LAREFAAIVVERRIDSWELWLAKVEVPGVSRGSRTFAGGLKQDEAAVKGVWSLA
jgi:hypothetical protein